MIEKDKIQEGRSVMCLHSKLPVARDKSKFIAKNIGDLHPLCFAVYFFHSVMIFARTMCAFRTSDWVPEVLRESMTWNSLSARFNTTVNQCPAASGSFSFASWIGNKIWIPGEQLDN